MRVKSDIFVAALVRRIFGRGDFATVERKGAAEAGAIFIRQLYRDGTETLYGPAPQSFFDDDATGERLFELRLDRVGRDEVSDVLAREARFDADLWVLEVETEELGGLLPLFEEKPEETGPFRR
ncbi:DUF1491 family protein [Sinorhizobium sp. BG8]|uniref:DUF1491 family protein n=1 Tax=Sinorhizobium sp. BG8 TaxID=2613773 RepID=UPI00193DDBA5|nr:DUF1491 family protein [Sinorhizobium sp. BG8]QRM54698.1 DUF1491 family protein [Sinorhizobium sp. BG8]